jgi:phosphatidylglycerol lysyltransferase
VGAAIALSHRLGNLKELAETAASARPFPLALALALQTAALWNQPALYAALYRMLGLGTSLRELAPVVWAGHFVNVATPSAGLGGTALLLADGRRRGLDPARVSLANTLYFLFNFAWFAALLAFGLAALWVWHDLKPYESCAAGLLFAGLVLAAAALVWVARAPDSLEKFGEKAAHRLNDITRRLLHRDVLDIGTVRGFVREFAEAIRALRRAHGRLALPVLHTLLVDGLEIFVLGACFWAFPGGGHVTPALVVTGYAIGTLFLILSITPQGLGVVEGIMAATFVSLGVPLGRATVVVLVYRGLSFWMPLAAGALASKKVLLTPNLPPMNSTIGIENIPLGERIAREREREMVPFRRHSLAWGQTLAVGLPALAVGAMGLLNVWSTVTRGIPARMQLMWDWLPFDARRGSHLAAAILGFVLLVLAVGLWRRKSVSWALALAALMISAIAHMLKGLDFEEASVALLLAVWLVAARRQFHARSDTPSLRQGLTILAMAFIFTLGYGAAGFYLLDDSFSVHFDVKAALIQTMLMFTSFQDPGIEPIRGFGRDFADSIYIVAASSFGYALFCLLRPLTVRGYAPAAEREAVEKIVERHGRTAFAFCALLPDKLYWHSPGGSVVAYALVGRVAVAMGDPIGPKEDAHQAIISFCEFCRRNDWRPAFYEVYREHLQSHREANLKTLRIAHEAIVDVQHFTLEGSENKSVRHSVNSAKRRGLVAKLHEPPLSNELLAQLRAVSDEWLAEMHGSEKGFSLGWFDEERLSHDPVMAIHDADGQIVAFANIVSCYNAPEVTLDLMRRVADSPNGAMELLFASLFEWAKEQGYEGFNIGPSPFALVGEHAEDPATEKAIHFIYEHMDHYYNFKGLHAFKEKFRPCWRPLFMTYEGTAGLPLVAAAIVRADSGESSWWGFLKGLRGDRD